MADPIVVYVCSEGHVNGPHWAENGCEECYCLTRRLEVIPLDAHRSEVEEQHEQMRGEICVRQSELDDIAELVGVAKDAPYGAVRDKVAECARAARQLTL